MGHDKLMNYFKTNFSLMQHHHWSLEAIENMIPWERYVYIEMLQQYLKEVEEQRKLQEQERKAEMARLQRQAQARK